MLANRSSSCVMDPAVICEPFCEQDDTPVSNKVDASAENMVERRGVDRCMASVPKLKSARNCLPASAQIKVFSAIVALIFLKTLVFYRR